MRVQHISLGGGGCLAHVHCRRLPHTTCSNRRQATHKSHQAQSAMQGAILAASAVAASAVVRTTEVLAFEQLTAAVPGYSSSLVLQPTGSGQHGLFTTKAESAGQVLMTVPKSTCLLLDYAQGLSLPAADWPRLQEGLATEEPLPWDLLLALALIDALAGDGGSFWKAYAETLLPKPSALTLPMCWTKERLTQLQHPAIIDACIAQQARLKNLFPDFSEPLDLDTPSWMQWAFACVRSRSIRAGADAFAVVPFLDFANHADSPTADFRVTSNSSGNDGGGGGSSDDGQPAVQLVAVQALRAGQEITISYTGREGMVNQQLMARYGFVPVDGNAADRLLLQAAKQFPGAVLQAERLQTALGSSMLMQLASNPHLFAAINSLPFDDGGTDEQLHQSQTPTMGGAGSGNDGAFTGSSSSSSSNSNSKGDNCLDNNNISPLNGQRHLDLAAALLQECKQMLTDLPTSLDEDERLLAEVSKGHPRGSTLQNLDSANAQNAGVSGTAAAAPDDLSTALGVLPDARTAAAVMYRLQRKRLMKACVTVLSIYARER